jgi:hypothetical protein
VTVHKDMASGNVAPLLKTCWFCPLPHRSAALNALQHESRAIMSVAPSDNLGLPASYLKAGQTTSMPFISHFIRDTAGSVDSELTALGQNFVCELLLEELPP